jgi:hypothetical protein
MVVVIVVVAGIVIRSVVRPRGGVFTCASTFVRAAVVEGKRVRRTGGK